MAAQEAPISAQGVRAWRERKGWTQEYAAKAAGVDARSWRRWEKGERRPPAMLGRWMRSVDLILSKGLRPDLPYNPPTEEEQ